MSPGNYKTLKLSIGAKTMCKDAVKKLLYETQSDQFEVLYETDQMCDKGILENGGTLRFFPDCYNNQKMCCKAVNNYVSVFFRVSQKCP